MNLELTMPFHTYGECTKDQQQICRHCDVLDVRAATSRSTILANLTILHVRRVVILTMSSPDLTKDVFHHIGIGSGGNHRTSRVFPESGLAQLFEAQHHAADISVRLQ